VFDIQRGVIDRITDGPTEDMMPAWSSDGKRIYFASDGDGVFSIFVVAADGSAPATRIFQGPDNYMPFFSPDPGRLLMFTHGPTAGSGDISLLRLTPPTRLEPVVHTKYRDGNPHVLPDSRWVAYQSEESGQPEIYIRSFPALDRKVIVPAAAALSRVGLLTETSCSIFRSRAPCGQLPSA
jgi:Tol biopolymer transport system component